MFPMGVIDRNGEGPLPDDFLDLPKAVDMLKAHGMRARQIYEAQLQDWGQGTTAGGSGPKEAVVKYYDSLFPKDERAAKRAKSWNAARYAVMEELGKIRRDIIRQKFP